MTNKDRITIGVCVGLGYIAGLSVYLGTRDRMTHQVPAHCRSQSWEDIQRDSPEHRRLCAAHYYARACSGRSREGCAELHDLAERDPQPEITELARRYPMIP